MDKKERYHIVMHQSKAVWIPLFVALAIMGVGYVFVLRDLFKKVDEPEPKPAPFVVDLRNEPNQVSIDYSSRWAVLVKVETADGVETRLMDPNDGHLIGTFLEKEPAGSLSE